MYRCTLVAVLFACGGTPRSAPTSTSTPTPTPTPMPHFEGRVLQANGTPRRGAVVVVSDAKNGDTRATVISADDGRFSTDLPPGTYAVTATAPDQSIYMATIDGSRAVDIRLDERCTTLTGRIDSSRSSPPGSVVNLTRYSDEVADAFAAALKPDGSFQACLPPGMYDIEPSLPHVVREAVVVVPHAGTFVYRTEAREDADRARVDLGGLAPESIEEFVAAFPATTRVLALGETNHGSREFYDERTALALKLATEHGVRLLMIEAGYAESLALDDYVNGANVDITRAVHELGYWTWDTYTFLRSLDAIRVYNASLPAAKRIRVVGIDVQSAAAGVRFLERHGGTSLSVGNRRLLQSLVPNKRDEWNAVPAADRAAIRAMLEPFAAKRGPGGATSRANRLALVARALLMRIDLLEATTMWEQLDVRDAGMARMVIEVLEHEKDGRATVWAHLAHVTREQMIGQRTMGAHLAIALGDSYRVYGLHAMSGAARAWDAKTEVGVVAHPLRVPPAGSLEATLGAANGGAPVTYWTFARSTGEAARWVTGVHALRRFGAVFRDEGDDFAYWDLRSFDGVILFQSVTPTEPTPTGERRAKPKQL